MHTLYCIQLLTEVIRNKNFNLNNGRRIQRKRSVFFLNIFLIFQISNVISF